MHKNLKFNKYLKIVLDYLILIIGCSMMAFSITSILRPNNLITGGITGISLLLDGVLNLPYTVYYYILALLVLLTTYIVLGKREVSKIINYGIIFPIILIIFERLDFRFIQDDLFLAAIYFGVIGGSGLGLILSRGFSSGGTDTIAKIFHKRLFPFVGVSQLLLFIDTIIILTSLIKYNINIALYAIITQFVFVRSIETILFGFSSKKVELEIISNEEKIIEDYILNHVSRGISKYLIVGGYTNIQKTKIVTICSPRESILIKNFISSVDKNAFISVMPVTTVWGKGIGFEPLIDDK